MFNEILSRIKEEVEDGHGDFSGVPEETPGTEQLFNLRMIDDLSLIPPQKRWEDYDQKEFGDGREMEMKFTKNTDLAAIMAANHLDEIPDYYTRLEKMMEQAAEESGEDILEPEEPEEELLSEEEPEEDNDMPEGRGRMGGSLAAGPGGSCVCSKCGHTVTHEVGSPCYDLECPKCGAPMTRNED